jgi:hypothetical protein
VRPGGALRVEGFFSPLDRRLDLRAEAYSPGLLENLEWLGAQEDSFEKGSQTAKRLLGLEITPKGLRNLTEKLGGERAEARDAELREFEKGKLSPQHPQPPQVVAAFLDGGRAQVRACGAPPGVHDPAWTETKVGNFSTYTNVTFQEDPQPEPPAKLLDPPRVARLVEELKGASGQVKTKREKKAKKADKPRPKTEKVPAPKKLVRTVVATAKNAEEFGKMAAAEATRRGFFQARKKAVLGDGSVWIWTIAALHFVGFEQILDFIHLVSYLYRAARAALPSDPEKAWALYEKILRLGWSGRTAELLEVLRKHAEQAGEPPKGARDDDPRKVLWGAVGYVENNKERMAYARYRREGLPISSCPVESLIRQVNIRVKGTQKFWVRGGLESILQVRAACLSDDGRLEKFWLRRPNGRAVGQNRFRRAG